MLGQTIQTMLMDRLGPQGIKQVFVWLQLGIGALILGGFIWVRSKPTESGFAVREADLRDQKDKKQKFAAKAPEVKSLAEAKIERKESLALPGIRIDGTAHEILGVKPGASAEEIQRAYRDRMKQYHPDKIGRPGSREWNDAQKIAEAVNRAKTELLKRFKAPK